MTSPGAGLADELDSTDSVAVAMVDGVGIGLARGDDQWAIPTQHPGDVFGELHAAVEPRWVWWGRETAARITAAPVAIDRGWDVMAVFRLLFGTWQASLGEAWAELNGLPLETLPRMGQLDLLDGPTDEGNPDEPLLPSRHLRPEWIEGDYGTSAARLSSWAELALQAMTLEERMLADRADQARALSTARSESAAALLCAEMSSSGLPVDVDVAHQLIGDAAGPRPTSVRDEDRIRGERDRAVLELAPGSASLNLRNPADVLTLLRRAGFELPDTRAWRLETLRHEPLIDALLTWRKAERIATTFGYGWLDTHVRGGRLRGEWASSDGAAGRMTASAGLHNLPSVMRPMVAAPEGSRFVRADLGQIEPRVLAAVSGDSALIEATRGDDLYSPVAERLGVERDIAKVAVLGAMYGATTGESAGALSGLKANYPVAMKHLETAAEMGRASQDIFTSGGRRVRMGHSRADGDLDAAVAAAAARGRYARNALIQGAAAEFFKVWAITVRRRGRPLGAEIVLCLHDELLVLCPADQAEAAATMVVDAVVEAAHYWSPRPDVRFLADVSIVDRWSDAK